MKILIIGQAPAAIKQEVPYDTTLLYDMFNWVGIDKNKAQEIFEFEAMTDKFPGYGVNGHLKPSSIEMRQYYNSVLKEKILNCEKVIVLGNVAKEALKQNGFFQIKKYENILFLIHPSRRNYSKIMAAKNEIINNLKRFVQ